MAVNSPGNYCYKAIQIGRIEQTDIIYNDIDMIYIIAEKYLSLLELVLKPFRLLFKQLNYTPFLYFLISCLKSY